MSTTRKNLVLRFQGINLQAGYSWTDTIELFEFWGTGEMIMITDSSDIGGGATLFQWQTLEHEQVPHGLYKTTGLNPDGTIKHDYPSHFYLAPLGNWNWKWSPTRQKYHIWELETLSGVLTLAANFRIVAGLPLIWLTDNEALTKFLDQEPPLNK